MTAGPSNDKADLAVGSQGLEVQNDAAFEDPERPVLLKQLVAVFPMYGSMF